MAAWFFCPMFAAFLKAWCSMRDRQCPRKHSMEGLISGKPDFSSLMELQAVRQQATRVGNWWRHVSVYKEWAARSFNVNLIFLTPKCQRCFALLSRFTRRKSKPFTADPVKLKAETRVRRRLLSDISAKYWHDFHLQRLTTDGLDTGVAAER